LHYKNDGPEAMKKKRILIVNCYFDELRVPIRRKTKIPQAMTPVYLAGAFSTDQCEVRLYNEQYSGPLESEALLSWPDMLVLTGLNTAFDRMLHLTAYARTENKNVIVVAGGPAIRALFHYSKRFFDYSCMGDIEQLAEVIEDSFGKDYVSRGFLENGWLVPRYDLAYWVGMIAYVESSRNCYNNCHFCSLTAEGTRYQPYNMEYIRRQFMAMGKRTVVIFIDNNFGSVDKQFIEERFELLEEMKERKLFRRWCALVSNDFFFNDENLKRSRDTGCLSLFSGVETFNLQALINLGKYQNTVQPQLEIIRRSLERDITFYYGMVFDIGTRTIAELIEEIKFMVSNPNITLPCYISLAIPILGTPFFRSCLDKQMILPNIRIRDLDSTTITIKPQDSMPDVVRFVRELQNLYGYRRKVISHSGRFVLRHRKNLTFWHMLLALYNSLLICTPKLATAGTDAGSIAFNGIKIPRRTYVGSTEFLDPAYSPAFRVDSRYEHYFEPTMLTDHEGNLSEVLQTDLLCS
jgi:hypothetical protein